MKKILLLLILTTIFGCSFNKNQDETAKNESVSFKTVSIVEEYKNFEKNIENGLVMYVAAWCPHCQAEIDELLEIDPENKKNIVMIFYPFLPTENGTKDYKAETLKYIEEKGLKYNILLDENKELLKEYAIKSIPVISVIENHKYVSEFKEIDDNKTIKDYLK